MKLFLIVILIVNIANCHPINAQDEKEKIIVYYVPWKAKFKGELNEKIIKEMNNVAIRHDTIINDSTITEVKHQLLKLEPFNEFSEIDLRMVCVLYQKDGATKTFSFGYAKMNVQMDSKVYYSNTTLLNLIEKNIKPHPMNQ
jgi:hypothetical protein